MEQALPRCDRGARDRGARDRGAGDRGARDGGVVGLLLAGWVGSFSEKRIWEKRSLPIGCYAVEPNDSSLSLRDSMGYLNIFA